mgnify:CR=1 FL=1
MQRRRVLQLASLLAMRPDLALGQSAVPSTVNGVEFGSLRGWLSNFYLWPYEKSISTVYPIPDLQSSGEMQSPGEVRNLIRMLMETGSAADVVQYNPNPASPDHNRLLASGYLTDALFARRPFFLQFEHANATRFDPANDDGVHTKNMSDPANRRVWFDAIDWMFWQVIWPNRSRYVTLNGRAIIYLWSVPQMSGDFASLLEETRTRYPVAFIGSVNLLDLPEDVNNLRTFRALDGFMEYMVYTKTVTPQERVLGAISYERVAGQYFTNMSNLMDLTRVWAKENGRDYLFVGTMTHAFDDRLYPGRQNLPMYPKSLAEKEKIAIRLRDWMGRGLLVPVGPFTIVNELFEGAAVIPAECTSETVTTSSRYVGCGYDRLNFSRDFFGLSNQ